VGEGTSIKDSILKNCLIQHNSSIESQVLKDSMIGSFANIRQKAKDLSVGDFTSIDDAL
jgi:glucose-1-phosphate thymidylyltransferase